MRAWHCKRQRPPGSVAAGTCSVAFAPLVNDCHPLTQRDLPIAPNAYEEHPAPQPLWTPLRRATCIARRVPSRGRLDFNELATSAGGSRANPRWTSQPAVDSDVVQVEPPDRPVRRIAL